MTRTIPLTQGKTALVDNEDFEMLNVSKWCISDGYAFSAARGRMHRLVLAAPPGVMVDHINGDKLDNRRQNLRLCSNSQNQANRQVSRGVSPFKGVTWQRKRSGSGVWKAQIVVGGRVIYLGVFPTDVDAARAYNAAAAQHFGEYAHLNDLSQPGCQRISDMRRQVSRATPSGYKGVTFDAARMKWMAQLAYQGKSYLKKRFGTAEEAARAYDAVAREVHGPSAKTNF